jgi:hypothetical protein
MNFALLALVLLSAPTRADDPVGPHVFKDMGLTIQPPPLEGLAFDEGEKGQVQGTWTGNIGSVQVEADLFKLPTTDFGFAEATDVVSLILDNIRDTKKRGDASFQWETKKLVPGP